MKKLLVPAFGAMLLVIGACQMPNVSQMSARINEKLAKIEVMNEKIDDLESKIEKMQEQIDDLEEKVVILETKLEQKQGGTSQRSYKRSGGTSNSGSPYKSKTKKKIR